jgi:hypothetical protein
MRITGRMILVAAVMLSVLMVPAATTPAHAEIVERARYCAGAQVLRCVWLNVDNTNGRVRAYASIRDASGGGNYDVAVNEIRVGWQTAGGDTGEGTGTTRPDHDGWHDFWDTGSSELRACSIFPESYRARAHFQWREYGGGEFHAEETLSSYLVSSSAC